MANTFTLGLLSELEEAKRRGYLLVKENKNVLIFSIDRHTSWCRREKKPFALIKIGKEDTSLVFDLAFSEECFAPDCIRELELLFSRFIFAKPEKLSFTFTTVHPMLLQHPSLSQKDAECLMRGILRLYVLPGNIQREFSLK